MTHRISCLLLTHCKGDITFTDSCNVSQCLELVQEHRKGQAWWTRHIHWLVRNQAHTHTTKRIHCSGLHGCTKTKSQLHVWAGGSPTLPHPHLHFTLQQEVSGCEQRKRMFLKLLSIRFIRIDGGWHKQFEKLELIYQEGGLEVKAMLLLKEYLIQPNQSYNTGNNMSMCFQKQTS